MSDWIRWTADRHKYTAVHDGWVATIYDAAADPNIHDYLPEQRCSWGVRAADQRDYRCAGIAYTPELAMAAAEAALRDLVAKETA